MFTKTIYKIFLCKFNNALKTNTSFFYSPANVFVEKFLTVLCENNLIQQYIIINNKESHCKSALIYLYPQKINYIKDVQKQNHRNNLKKAYKITFKKISKYSNINYIISTVNGLKLTKNNQNLGTYIAVIAL